MAAQIVRSLAHRATDRHVLTIGNFDGVHRGHQYLIDQVTARARELGVKSAAVTFDPLPAEVLRPERAPRRLTTTEDRLALLAASGLDTIFLVTFDRDFAQLEAEEFVRQLVAAAQPAEIVVGADFAFGHGRRGNPDLLADMGATLGYSVRVVERIGGQDGELSSTRVRRLLAEGDVRSAGDLLGRPFAITDVVREGARRGRALGYPTANLEPPANLAVPADGIYAGLVSIEMTLPLVPAMVYVGTRPTFDNGARIVEANLLDFSDDLYGRVLTVLFVDHVRGDRRFESVDELIRQMALDEAETRRLLATLPDGWPGEEVLAVLGIGEGVRTREH